MNDKILGIFSYLEDIYDPSSILLFGSYIDGSFTSESDLDILVITDRSLLRKDESIINGIQLDCDIYSKKDIELLGPSEFIRIHDAVIIKDDGAGQELKAAVNRYLEQKRITSDEQKQSIINWTKKTIGKLSLNTDDSNFRAALLLWESLPNYFFLRDLIYYGSKKAISYIKENDPKGYDILHRALNSKSLDDIRRWGIYVIGEP